MNTQLVILFSLFALGSVMADVYYVGRQMRGQVLRFQSGSVARKATAGFKLDLSLDDETDTFETETDTDSDTEIVPTATIAPTPSAVAASPSPAAASPSAVAASPSAPAASPSRSPEPNLCGPNSCQAHATCSVSNAQIVCTCEQGYEASGAACTAQKTVSGKLNMPGSAADFDSARLSSIGEGIANTVNLDKSLVKTTLGKQGTVTVVFVVYIPGTATVTLDSVTSSLSNLDALLAAINQALVSAGFPPVASLTVVFDPSASPTPSPSASVSISIVEKAESKDDNKLSDGAIAGIVIGSVAGAALLVALIVFVQMRTTQRAHARTSSKMTAQAVEAEAAKGGKNSLNAQF